MAHVSRYAAFAVALSVLLWLGIAGAGIFRAVTGLSFTAGVFAAFFAAVAVTVFAGRYRCRVAAALDSHGIALIVFALTTAPIIFRMYYPPFDGLVSVGGGDAGVHAHFQRQFIDQDPTAYHSFAVFPAVTFFFERFFGMNTFESFRLFFYWTLAVIIAASMLLAETSAESCRRTAYWAIFLLAVVLPAERIILPILHYLQAEGFMPQYAGIVPLLLTWIAIARINSGKWRALGFCLGLCITRFTYGLNLPELALTGAVLAAAAGTAHRHAIGPYFGAAFGLAALAAFTAGKLLPVFEMSGGTIAVELRRIFAAQAILGVVLLTAGLGLFRTRTHPGADRLFAFAGIYTLSALALGVFYSLNETGGNYYPYKQTIVPVIIAVTGVCLAAPHILLVGQKQTFRTALFVAAAFVALWQLKQAFRPYRASYRERVESIAQPKLLMPLADRTAWREIATALGQENARFAGYISTSWPVSSFMNASFGYFGEMPFFLTARYPKLPHSCVFWNSDAASLAEYEQLKGKVHRTVTALQARSGVVRVPYTRREDSTARELAYWCSED